MDSQSFAKQPCARWECGQTTTYERPLCYQHWKEYEAWELEECNKCHWVYGDDDFVLYDVTDLGSDLKRDLPLLCNMCLQYVLAATGKLKLPSEIKVAPRQIHAHAPLKRPDRYIYILKLSDNTFYIGQTTNLAIRLREHRDGSQTQTKGKDPKLVFFESYEGDLKTVNKRENELTKLNQTPIGRRQLLQLIEDFRTPLKLLDLEA